MSQRRILPTIRAADPTDASAISALYLEAYTPNGHGDPYQNYPFPQLFDSEQIELAVCDKNIYWLVAEYGKKVIGAVGAIRNIGNKDDCVAEAFGLVVRKEFQCRGIGYELFKLLHKTLIRDGALFIIAETRTAHSGGWKIVKHCGFIPVGFEPFAHTTPAGMEPMLLAGTIAKNSLALRETNYNLTSKAQILSEQILKSLKLPFPSDSKANSVYYQIKGNINKEQLIPVHDDLYALGLEIMAKNENMQVLQNDTIGYSLLEKWKEYGLHLSGVVGLSRLEGIEREKKRYDRKYFVGYIDQNPIACMYVIWDKIDCRVRILNLQILFHGIQGLMFAYVLQSLHQEVKDKPLTVVVDVRSDNKKLQITLEKLGFFPTAYYPSLISCGLKRIDAIQYTRLFNLCFEGNLKFTNNLNWFIGQKIVNMVTYLSKKKNKGSHLKN